MTTTATHALVAARLPRREASFKDAPCVDRYADFDLPRGSHGEPNSRIVARMLPALRLCAACPLAGVGGPCWERVDPQRSYHDGVAAGFLFRNGRRVEIKPQWVAA